MVVTLPILACHYERQAVNYNYLSYLDTFSTATLRLNFSRQLEGNLITVYVPSAIIVVVSWASLFMTLQSAIPGRILLAVTALIAMVTQFSSSRVQLPSVSYINAVDIWMLACLF